MLNFRELRDSDRALVEKRMGNNPTKMCEFCPSDFFYWGRNGDVRVAIEGEDLFIRWSTEGFFGYAYPFAEDEERGIQRIVEQAKREGSETSFVCLTEEQAKKIQTITGLPIVIDRDWFDYLYKPEDLRDLPGKKYHGQKNHRNKFLATYPRARYHTYSSEWEEKALVFADRYYRTENQEDMLFTEEREVFLTRLRRPNEREESGLIEIDGEIVAMTFGEILGDVLYVHSEKALRDYPGSYVMINTLFVDACLRKKPFLYVNREEDLGIEGLRKAKMSWHPVLFVEKRSIKIV